MSIIRYIQIVTATTCEADETSHTVKFQPIEATYPVGALTATQGSVELSIWYATLDEDTTYDLYVDDTRQERYQAYNAIANIGG